MYFMNTERSISVEVGMNVRAELARSGQTIAAAATALNMSAPAFRRRLKGQVPFNVAELKEIQRITGTPFSELVKVTEKAIAA